MDPYLLQAAALLALPDSLHPLIHALTLAYTFGPWLVLATVLYCMLRPYLQGSR
jgi:hypothetical protein